jgi:two-component system, OmpR family, sensor histidine kinase VicK
LTEPLNESLVQRTEVWHGKQVIIKRGQKELSKVKIRYDSILDSNGPSIIVNNEFVIKTYADIMSRGCSLRLITEISKANVLYCKKLAKYVELRHFDGIKGNFGIVDGISYGGSARSKERQFPTEYIYSTVKSFVEQQQYFFDMLWNKAIPAEQRIRQIEEGIEPEIIETIRDPIKIQAQYIDLIKSSTKEIMLMIPTVNAFHIQHGIGILKLLHEVAIKEYVNIRILSPLNDVIQQQQLQQNLLPSSYVHIRNIETSSATKSTILVVDRKESLVIEVKDDLRNTFTESIGFATYSNSRSTVLSYISIFESFWLQTEMYKKVKETEQMQKEFINIAAHELRGPIQPILGLTEVLRNKAADKEQKELQDAVFRSAKKLKQLTEDVLDVTRIESQSLQLHKEHFNLSEMILNTIVDCRNQIIKEYKDIIKIELVSNEDVIVEADRNRLNQVISNLLNNAIKFTDNEGIITTSVEKKKKDNHVIVSIKDTGTGIDPEISPRLFSKFVTKSDTGGTGLGLFISKNIVEAHGGRMWAENNNINGHDGIEKRGATFAFSLPLSNEQLTSTAATTATDSSKQPSLAQSSSLEQS